MVEPRSSDGPVRVSRAVYSTALRQSEVFGRPMRLDSAQTQGVSTQWFQLSAFDDGDWDAAWDYCVYEREDYKRLAATVLGGWLEDLCGYVEHASWSGARSADLMRAMRTQMAPRLEGIADAALGDLRLAIDLRSRPFFEAAQRSLREAHIASNDLAVRMIQDLMTAIGQEEGDQAIVEVLELSYQHIWKDRYKTWLTLNSVERLALSSEGMRAHYSGKGRRGDFTVIDRDDDYLMSFDPCGTGQVMRRGDDPREGTDYLPIVRIGSTRTAADWNQHTVGMPYYCAHCPVLMEHFPLRDLTIMLRPVNFSSDPRLPCEWSVPKVLSTRSDEGRVA